MLYRKSTYAFLFLTFLLLTVTASATTYYLSSSSGNDSNSGTDPSSAWQSIDKLNSFYNLRPGDNVLFKRGDTFYGGIVANNSGNSGSPITYGAYGSGSKPIVTGFTNVTSWNNLGGNIWESRDAVSSLPYTNMVAVNGVNTAMGRYPNSGYLSYQSHNGNTSITSNGLNGANWTGAGIAIKKQNWYIESGTIKSQYGGTLNYSDPGLYTPTDGFGFFIQNDPRTLDLQNEWYYNPSTKKLRIYSTSMPYNVQISTVGELFSNRGNHPFITITDLSFTGSNSNMISLYYGSNETVKNCDLSFGGINGINVDGVNADMENNNITDIGGTGIFVYKSDAVIKSNSLSRIGLIAGNAREDADAGIYSNSANALIQDNQLANLGHSGIVFYGNNSVVKNNFINKSCLVLDDGGGICTHGGFSGQQIIGNIVLNSMGAPEGTSGPSNILAHGIFLDDLSNGVTVANNSVAGCRGVGIDLHRASNITIDGNTCFDNGVKGNWMKGEIMFQCGPNTPFTGIKMNNNIFFAKTVDQLALFCFASPISDYDLPHFGTMDNNYYARPIKDESTILITGNYYNVPGWQSYMKQDIHSKGSPKSITNLNDLRFEYNATSSSKTIQLDGTYIDVKNVSYNGSIILAPYTSAVLIRNGAATQNENLLPAVNPSNAVNGLDYKYYEASNYTTLPSFSSSTPLKTGTSSNFDISLANRSNNYAFNFTGYIDVPADGQYTFYTTSDDGSKLYIDNNPVVDNDGTHAAVEQSGTIGLKAGKHAISVGYFQASGGNVLSVSYSGPGVSKQVIPPSALYRVSESSANLLPAVNPSGTINGLDYKYYEASNYTTLPSFSSSTPVKTGTSSNVDISLADRSTNYAFNFTGYIEVPADGQYTFYTTSDDGSDLYIDDVSVVDNDGLHASTEKSGTIGLKAGKHAITVGYFQASGGNVLSVSYSGPGVSKQVIPSSALYRVAGNSNNLLPAVNPSSTVNGIDYKYYEAGSFTNLPDFNTLSPVKTGSSNNFDISVANRSSDYSLDFTGYIDVPADGQYTFYASSDDGSNLSIDNVPLVNNDGLHSLSEQSGTIGLKAGKHLISVGFFQHLIDQTLIVSYAGPGVSKQVIPSSVLYRVAGNSSNLLPAVNPSSTVNGIDYKYYEAGSFTNLPDFNTLSPVKTGSSNNFDISVANRSSDYSLNFTGYINVPSDGQYTFYTSSDDGSNLSIDNVPVVNNDGLHSLAQKSGTIGLKAGMHLISVGFFQHLIDQTLIVSYAGPGVSKQIIPSSALYRTSSLLRQSVMVNSSSAMMFSGDSTNFQMQRLLNSRQMMPGVKVYPNPFRNSFELDINGGSAKKLKLMLTDASGKIVWSRDVQGYNMSFHESVNTSALPIGVYFLNVIQDSKNSVTKLLKEY